MTTTAPGADPAIRVTVDRAPDGPEVPATVLGQNLEMHTRTIAALLSDRLENPKFAGPPDAGGLAPPWRRRSLTPKMSHLGWIPSIGLSGDGVHWIANYQVDGQQSVGIVQTHRRIRRGEVLRAELWARTRHRPTTLTVGLFPPERIAQPHVAGSVVVDTTYWKKYQVGLTVETDDDDAVFELAVSGFGQVWIDQVHLRGIDEPVLDQGCLDAIARLHVPALRYPGGTRAATYRWRDGIGPVDERPDVFDAPHHFLRLNDFGTDEYLELCVAQGITPHLTVNTGSSTPEEAAAWAAHVRGWFDERNLDPGQPYFQVGNEDYGGHEFSHMTPGMYARTLDDYVPALRAAHPGARIIANVPARTIDVGEPDRVRWRTDEVLAAMGRNAVDVAAIHVYKGQLASDPIEQMHHVRRSLTEVDAALGDLRADLTRAGLSCRLALTEWNYLLEAAQHDGSTQLERYGPAYHETYDGRHCLFIAGMIHQLVRRAPDLELANFYTLLGPYGVLTRPGPSVEWSPAATIFAGYRELLPGRLIDLRPAADDTTVAGPPVDLLALGTPTATALFVVNFDTGDPVTLDLTGLSAGRIDVLQVTAATPTDTPVTRRRTVDGDDRSAVVVDPLSVVRFLAAPRP